MGFKAIVSLAYRSRIKGISFDNVSASLKVGAMNSQDQFRLREIQEVIVPTE
jgi:hypothetical protein